MISSGVELKGAFCLVILSGGAHWVSLRTGQQSVSSPSLSLLRASELRVMQSMADLSWKWLNKPKHSTSPCVGAGGFWIMFANVEQERQCCACWTVYTFIYILKQRHFTCLSAQHLLSSSLQCQSSPTQRVFMLQGCKGTVKVALLAMPFCHILLWMNQVPFTSNKKPHQKA